LPSLAIGHEDPFFPVVAGTTGKHHLEPGIDDAGFEGFFLGKSLDDLLAEVRFQSRGPWSDDGR
jgi:hypothetical protein